MPEIVNDVSESLTSNGTEQSGWRRRCGGHMGHRDVYNVRTTNIIAI